MYVINGTNTKRKWGTKITAHSLTVLYKFRRTKRHISKVITINTLLFNSYNTDHSLLAFFALAIK